MYKFQNNVGPIILTIVESYISYMDNIFNILDKNRTNKSHVILQKNSMKPKRTKGNRLVHIWF